MPRPAGATTPKVIMPTSRSTSEADAFLAAHPDAETVDMVIADMNGILRGKQLARNYLKKLYSDGVRLPGSNYLLDWTGQNVTTLKFGTSDGDPDYFCFPVKGTLKSVPWSLRPSGQVLASMFHEDGTPWFADPRHILARAMQPLADMGLTPVVAIEYEFYLIDQKAAAEGVVRPAASPQSGWRSTTTSVYALDDLYDFEELLGDIHEACALQGIPAETFVKEYAPGQFEINLHHIADPLEACDQAILLERAIKQVARRHGVIATFMAKPFAERVGSGLHVHVSLIDRDGRNVFAGPADAKIGRPISDTLRHAIGGLLATMPEAMAIFAPNANSYRRLRPGTYAPVRGLWGGDNRTVPLRIPGGGEKSVRIEHRVAGADANPYLVVAAVLAGIHHGIAEEIAPQEPVVGDGYSQDGGVALPIRWPLALQQFADGEVLKPYLGETWCEAFHTARSFEAENHHFTIPTLDYEWYLRTA
jgi:glutamine synthetase